MKDEVGRRGAGWRRQAGGVPGGARVVADAVQLAAAGVPIERGELAEKTGYPLSR